MSDKNTQPQIEIAPEPRLRKEVGGYFLLALTFFLVLCLGSYSSQDPSLNSVGGLPSGEQVHNLVGRIGANLADLLYQAYGLTAWLFPLVTLILTLRMFRLRRLHISWQRVVAVILLQISLAGLLAILLGDRSQAFLDLGEAGGAIGRISSALLRNYLNTAGALLVLVVCALSFLLLSTRFSLVLFVDGLLGRVGRRIEEQRAQRKARTEKILHHEPEIHLKALPEKTESARTKTTGSGGKKKSRKRKEKDDSQEVFDFLEPDGVYHFPSSSLLDHEEDRHQPPDRESLTMSARMLERKLLDFGVEGEVVEVKPGPVVTMYEFAPAAGVKVNKITNLQDDLAMAMQAVSIRIVAPIPGRGVVGIEIPNHNRETVYLKEIIASDQFQRHGGRLPMALGKDIFGQTVVSDLAKMPHLLVAGATGSGKSVSINTMILSLLYCAAPEDVRLIMIDPKMIELSIYEGIPHLLLPVVTDPKKASLALAWAVREMERRYQLLADKGVRNLEGYNRKLAKEAQEDQSAQPAPDGVEDAEEEILQLQEEDILDTPLASEPEEELEHGHMSYIVVIVDELADLMMVAGREIEESIARLAQKARAAGIHLILATQRPSVDVITGLIKANFPTRISFKVFSRTDSRTILDSMGAEALLGMGDMLFLPPGVGYLQRVHGALVTELEVQRVVDFLSRQAEPDYDQSILQAPSGEGAGGSAEEEGFDERWDEALRIVSETRQASISMLQRRLRVGYNRAARMVERMEKEGVVGPADGSGKPREVLIGRID